MNINGANPQDDNSRSAQRTAARRTVRLCQPPNPEHDNLSLPPSRFASFNSRLRAGCVALHRSAAACSPHDQNP